MHSSQLLCESPYAALSRDYVKKVLPHVEHVFKCIKNQKNLKMYQSSEKAINYSLINLIKSEKQLSLIGYPYLTEGPFDFLKTVFPSNSKSYEFFFYLFISVQTPLPL